MNEKIEYKAPDEKMLRLRREKTTAQEYQDRKFDDWTDNYELYRNKVRTNRLTQRQAVNIPLMKETVKTILSKIDDAPNVDWKEKSADEMKEIVYQELWNDGVKENKLDWLDVIDKKNVLLYGLSTKMLDVGEDRVDIRVLDNWDIMFDPMMSSTDIETARFIIRKNIFRSIKEILADDRYSEKGKDKLRMFAAGDEAIVQSEMNREQWEKRNDRLMAMGVQSDDFNNFAAGDVIVNLTEHYTKEWNKDTESFEKRVVVYADDWCELMDEKLIDLIGVEEYPFVVWYEDPETNDVYPDGIADLVRTPNKILNIWFSQQVENRTLQNFQMHWYDATVQGYTPQTYEPGPGRMLPAPGNPRETIMPVEINGLDETFTAIDFLTKVVERGSGAVAIEKGTGESGSQTLGEVEILVGKAMERSVAMQKFYRGSWYELAKKWDALMHANSFKSKKLYKTGRSGKLYEKEVTAKDWKSDAGYEPIVSSSSEQEANNIKTIQKFNFVVQQSPNNMALKKIAQKRQLELLDLAPDEMKEIQDAEEQMAEQMEAAQEAQKQLQQQAQQQPAGVGVESPVQTPDGAAEAQAIGELEQSLAQI